MMTAFAALTGAGKLRDGPNGTFTGTCPACSTPLTCVPLGTSDDPPVTCAAGCSEQALVAALQAPPLPRPATAAPAKSRAIRWAWTGRLALDYLCVLTGLEGIGKSTFVAWMVAQLTRGELVGELQDRPVNVLIVAGEDGLADVWQPRLHVAGADLERVHFLNLEPLGSRWNIAGGIDELRAAVKDSGARIVVFDALLDHFPPPVAGESVNSATFVRAGLAPLRALARDMGLSIVFSLHPPKGARAEFRDLVQTSQAFTAIARVGLLVAWHPEDDDEHEDDRRRVLIRGKGNIGRNPGALAFRVTARLHEHDDGRVSGVPLVTEVEPCEITMRDLAPGRMVGTDDPEEPKVQQLAQVIAGALADGEWQKAADVLDGQEFTKGTIARAKRAAGVETERRGYPAQVFWRLRAAPSRTVDPQDPQAPRARSLSDDGPTGTETPQTPHSNTEGLRVHTQEPGEDTDPQEAQRVHTDTDLVRASATPDTLTADEFVQALLDDPDLEAVEIGPAHDVPVAWAFTCEQKVAA